MLTPEMLKRLVNSVIYYIGSVPCTPADLKHWGLLGMKWGVRRFRNKDGTLTAEGKVRYNKPVKEMSDDELRSAVGRMKLETEYTRLKKEIRSNSPIGKAVTAGKIAVNRISKIASTVAYATIIPFSSSFSREFGTGLGRVLTNPWQSSNKGGNNNQNNDQNGDKSQKQNGKKNGHK